ncbi:hypothetical protein [Luteibacter yeojuensis]|uniref:Uncharacterized protein n=1 Tax=Luteibacter yeojuensis TaxID=345309 RepID=A0A0F3KUE1_9GAMM|nr:hypothetical protein [Luteibacter yeojuensis]KJV34843.1 hypothetical protein VI08_09725 [Luteibacter yeojuensis]
MSVSGTRQLGLLFAGLLVVSAAIAYAVVRDGDGGQPGALHESTHETAHVAAVQALPGPVTREDAADANISAALDALSDGRATCVAGVVYATSGHVIEPWPGHIRCDQPADAGKHAAAMADR